MRTAALPHEHQRRQINEYVNPAGRAGSAGAHEAASSARSLRRGLLSTVALAALLLAIGFAVPGLKSVLRNVGNASPAWLIAGVVFEVLSCLGYVVVLRLILDKGPARGVRLLAWAEMAFGAVVPAGGAGSVAVGMWAMRSWQVDTQKIAERSALLFMLTSAINVIVLLLSGLGLATGLGLGHLSIWYGLIPAAAAAGCLIFFAYLPRYARRGARSDRRVARWMAQTGARVALTRRRC